MSRFVRYLGWAVNASFLVLAVGGAASRLGFWNAPAIHMRAGLVVTLAMLLLHSLPYFHLTGSVSRFRNAIGDDPMARERLDLAVRLKASLFWPTLVVVAITLLGPIVAFLQMVSGVPPWSHGAFMVVVAGVHVRTWAKELFTLGLMDGVFESAFDEDHDHPGLLEEPS